MFQLFWSSKLREGAMPHIEVLDSKRDATVAEDAVWNELVRLV
jgi:hypothetical protein